MAQVFINRHILDWWLVCTIGNVKGKWKLFLLDSSFGGLNDVTQKDKQPKVIFLFYISLIQTGKDRTM